MEIRLLGPLEASNGAGQVGLGGPGQRAVLAYLALHPNVLVLAETLIESVWTEEPPRAARNVIQSYVSRLRKVLGQDRLVQRAGGYVLDVDPDDIDAFRFRELVQAARSTAIEDPATSVALYHQAEDLWRGAALEDLAELPSLRGLAANLEELRIAALEDRIALELTLGRDARLVPEVEELTARYPLHERMWAHLMTALYRSGRQADALSAYQRVRALLSEELGIEPAAELKRLQQQILQQGPVVGTAGVPLRGFQLLERVGAGSFGIVHRAVQTQVGREVAIKVVRPELANDRVFIRRFESEAQLVARLEHPHIVPLHDYWRDPDGAYLVMRYLRGGTLRDRLDGGWTVPDALRVATQIGTALGAAHAQGVVHRDVKPANVLFDEDGNAYLSDFGIALDAAARASGRQGSRSRTAYSSPEVQRGEKASPRADVFSLGLVLREMLTPHVDRSPELVEALARATADDPAARFEDASAFSAAIAVVPEAGRLALVPREHRNPYKGLRPFDEADAADFVGREALVARLVDRMGGTGPGARFVALVGASGSGKSSALRAGLVPALRAGAVPGSAQWLIVETRFGVTPFASLAQALMGLSTEAPPADLAARLSSRTGLSELAGRLLPEEAELLLVADQFEELFLPGVDDATRDRFLDTVHHALTEPHSRVRLAVTLRADHLDAPLSDRRLAELLQHGTELVPPLDADDLARVISEPARRVGVAVEPPLLAVLVADVVGRPSPLPLLQFALAELFDRQRSGTLTLAAYDEIGGVGGAVAAGAEETYAALSQQQQKVARTILLQLVYLAASPTGRRVPRSELAVADEEVDGVVEALAARRLLTVDRDPVSREPTVELAHDALLSAWARLQTWVEESLEQLRTRHQVEVSAADWEASGQDPSYLATGSRLEQFEAWHTGTDAAPNRKMARFLAASLAERDRARAEEDARATRERQLERRSIRRLRLGVGILAAAVVVASGLLVFAFDQREQARRDREVAIARQLASASIANLDIDPERSILLALAALEHAGNGDLPEIEDALHRAMTEFRLVLRVPDLGGLLAWSPDGSRFVTEGPEESGVIDIRDADTGERLIEFAGHEADVNLVAFDAQGAVLGTTADDGMVRLWDPETGAKLGELNGTGSVWGLSFSPDGRQLAAGWPEDGAVRVFDRRTERVVHEVTDIDPSLHTSFSPDGRRLAIATFFGGSPVLDLTSGQVLRRLGPREVSALDVDWSPDGRWLAITSTDARVRVFDAETLALRFTLTGHESEVVASAWSHDSRRLVTGSNDGTARVWEVDEEETREALVIHAQERGGGVSVAFSPDGQHVMTGDQEITQVKIWDVSPAGGGEWANHPLGAAETGAAAFVPDSTQVVVGGLAPAVWDGHTRVRELPLDADAGPLHSMAVSGSGDVAGTDGGSTYLWRDGADRAERLRTEGGRTHAVMWSPDGGVLAVAHEDQVAVFGTDGVRQAFLPAAGAGITAIAFSPDGDTLAVGTLKFPPVARSGRVRLWDWRSGSVRDELTLDAWSLAYTPDGSALVAAPPVGAATVWNLQDDEKAATLSGHTGAVTKVAVSPDGSRVASASTDGTVRLWETGSGRLVQVLRGGGGTMWDVAFNADGTRLVTVGSEGIARVWALEVEDLAELARSAVSRDLTREECRQYLGDLPCP